eukprot:Hpha_TRINITY_DN27964_c0_g1::TRINITY_DN27964_c0_g1_i1::g.44938::m.44938
MPCVLILGATGNTGKAAVQEVLSHDAWTVRVLTRSAEKAKAVLGEHARLTAIEGSGYDAVRGALEGADVVAVHLSIMSPPEVESNREAYRAVADYVNAGGKLKHFIKIGNPPCEASDAPVPMTVATHLELDKEARELPLDVTILKPTMFTKMHFVDFEATSFKANGGKLVSPYKGDTGISYIDDRDVGAASAAVILNAAKFAGKELPLTAGVTTLTARAALLGDILGKSVVGESVDEDTAAKQMVRDMHLPEGVVQVLLQYPRFANAGGCDKVYPELAEVLALLDPARKPIDLRQTLEDNKAAFQ